MEEAGQKLKRARERLNLRYRDVEQASQRIAERRESSEFGIALSRLSDIENKGTLPTIYRLYTLCAIYRLDWKEVLSWYGVPLELIPADSLHIRLQETHAIHFPEDPTTAIPQELDQEVELHETTFLKHLTGRWGKMPLSFLSAQD